MFTDDNNTARQARGLAQWIAFAPSIFQAARVLRETGLLAQIEASGATGLSLAELEGATKITKYATRVLADAGLGMQLLTLRDGRYRTTKAAWFLLHDPMTRVNMNFTHEINYRGM